MLYWHAEAPITDVMHGLLLSAMTGDWERAKKIFEGERNVKEEVTSTIQGIDILDAAVKGGQWEYFIELVQVMNPQTLAMRYERGEYRLTTILHRVASIEGRMKSAKALVEECQSLTQIIVCRQRE